MDIQATAKYVRVSPRKLMLVADSVRQLSAKQAVATLMFINKSGARELRGVILSALANAKTKNVAGADELIFKTLSVYPGSAMKRFRAVSRGMAHEYKKRMSHIKVVLTEKTNEIRQDTGKKDKNLKFEARNSKQIQNSNASNTK